MKIGDRVITPDGEGIITGYDLPESERTKRYIVELDKNKYDYIPCYFAKELKKEVQG
jgi:hypothetical protein